MKVTQGFTVKHPYAELISLHASRPGLYPDGLIIETTYDLGLPDNDPAGQLLGVVAAAGGSQGRIALSDQGRTMVLDLLVQAGHTGTIGEATAGQPTRALTAVAHVKSCHKSKTRDHCCGSLAWNLATPRWHVHIPRAWALPEPEPLTGFPIQGLRPLPDGIQDLLTDQLGDLPTLEGAAA